MLPQKENKRGKKIKLEEIEEEKTRNLKCSQDVIERNNGLSKN